MVVPKHSRATLSSDLGDAMMSTDTVTIRAVLDLLAGCWSIDRRITPGGHFTGMASFTHHATDSLLYQEIGRLILDNGMALQGQNSYVYTLRDGRIEISFTNGPSKGGRFIDICLPEGHAGVLPIVSVDRHQCRKDTYDAVFRIDSPAVFTMTYIVNGPGKQYVSRSVYRRSEPGK